MVTLRARPDARPVLEAWVAEHGTAAEAAASHPEARALQGRGRVHVVPAPGGDRWVVRHYRRGGTVASALGDRYLRVGKPRPFHELEIGWRLEELGVPVPCHVAALVYPAGPWYRGDLVTEYVPGSRDLAAVLFGDGPALVPPDDASTDAAGAPAGLEPAAAMRAAGRLVRTLHEAGVVHRDLNIKNVLLASKGDVLQAYVLDLDRATLRASVGDRARHRMVERFWRSARKWENRTGQPLGPELRGAFYTGYDRSA